MTMKQAVAQAEDLVPGVWELASMALAIQEAIYRGLSRGWRTRGL